jgi:hypothetical protein
MKLYKPLYSSLRRELLSIVGLYGRISWGPERRQFTKGYLLKAQHAMEQSNILADITEIQFFFFY